jgi:hypothetical protein
MRPVSVPDRTRIVADFAGGPLSGRQHALDDDHPVISVPVFAEDHAIAGYWREDPEFVTSRIAVYRRTGVRDDGRRVYAYDARASTG